MSVMTRVPARTGAAGSGEAGRAAAKWTGLRGETRASRALLRTLGIGTGLLVWHLYAIGPGEQAGLPTPYAVFDRFLDLVQTGDYWSSVWKTLLAAVVGTFAAIAVGVPLGLVNGSNPKISTSTQFIVDFLRTVPPVAVVPLLLLIFGGTGVMVQSLILFGAVWPLLIQSTYAMQQVSPQLKSVATAFNLTRWERIRTIYVPSAMPFIMTGLRLSAILSLLLAVVGQYFGVVPGLGSNLQDARFNGDSVSLFVYAFTCAVLGLLINGVVVVVQRRLLFWHPSVRGAR